jgi:tRNA (guanine37-N1)-methyltransferase
LIRTINILTIFPEIFDSFLETGLVQKARAKGIVDIHRINIRDFARDAHRSVDDTPYGGGAGMLMKVEPLVEAIEASGEGKRIVLVPQGQTFTHGIARDLAGEDTLTLICGRYEGFDERIFRFVDMQLSIGDFVLHGGEVAAMAVIEAVVRLQPQFMGNRQSLSEESYASGILEYPQYTRPPSFRDMDVPPVLLSGNHEKIRQWRRGRALLRTKRQRPDIFAAIDLSSEDRALLEEAEKNEE